MWLMAVAELLAATLLLVHQHTMDQRKATLACG